MTEPLTPVNVEDKLRRLVTQLTQAQQALAAARDAETEAEKAYRRVHVRAVLSPECPKVTRGGFTTADRDAWVDLRCEDQYEALLDARTARETAGDHLRTVRDVAEVVRSLGASVRTAYGMAGVS